MYHENQIPFTCPYCQQTGSTVIHDIISRDEQPELKTKILSGNFFEYVCPYCGSVTPILYPCLYQDREKKYMIHLADDELSDHVFDEMDDMETICRTVRDPNQFAEKIAILDDERDDRAVEICKLYRKIRLEERNKDMKVEALYYQPEKEGPRFAVLTDRGMEGTIRFDQESYQAVCDEIVAFLPKELLRQTEIDEEWAIEAAKRMEEQSDVRRA